MEPRLIVLLGFKLKRTFLFKEIRCRNMTLKYIEEILPSLINGTWMTIKIFFWTLCLALPIGIIASLCEMSHIKIVKWLVKFYVLIMRGDTASSSVNLCLLWVTDSWGRFSTLSSGFIYLRFELCSVFCRNFSWWDAVN